MVHYSGPAFPYLWGHPVIPIYGDIFKNRHMVAYGKGANIAFLVYASKTAKSYMMKTFFWDRKVRSCNNLYISVER